MPTAINNIVGGFPFPTILPIIGTPTYNTIAEVNFKLNSNSTSVQCNLVCGTLGLLQLNVYPAVYNTLLSITFIVSVSPGSVPIIPDNSTGAQITKLFYAFDTAYALFNEYDRTNKALRQILPSTVDKIFTSDTASSPPVPSWITCMLPTPTSPPRICRKTMLYSVPFMI